MFNRLLIHKEKTPQWQIADFLREAMVRGELVPGTRLPPTDQLAAMWHVPVKTAQAAMATLAREGLLHRRSRRGTFVRKREDRLTCVAIYCTESTWTEESTEYQRVLHAALKRELSELGIETRFWIDSRPIAEQDRPLPDLAKAVQNREVHAMIATVTDLPHLAWQTKLPIPLSYPSVGPHANAVGTMISAFPEQGLRHLARQGCRSVGLIAGVVRPTPTNRDPSGIRTNFFHRFSSTARELGLRCRDEWILGPATDEACRNVSQLRLGYAEFGRLWQQPEKPDGLLVFPEGISQGVLFGIVERQVRVPQDLRLVLHKTQGVDLLCPLPATYLASSATDMARGLIQQVRRQFRGEPAPFISLPFAFVEAAGDLPNGPPTPAHSPLQTVTARTT